MERCVLVGEPVEDTIVLTQAQLDAKLKAAREGASGSAVIGTVILCLVLGFMIMIFVAMFANMAGIQEGIKQGGLKAIDNPGWAEGLRLEREGRKLQSDSQQQENLDSGYSGK